MANSPNQTPSPGAGSGQANNNVAPVVGPPAAALPQGFPPPANQGNPQQKRRWTNDPAMFFVTLAGFIVLCIYTYYAHQQVVETRIANQFGVEAVTESNKPYVNFTNLNFIRVKPTNGDTPKWQIGPTWTNYGNSSASRATTTLCDPILRDSAAPPKFVCNVSDETHNESVIGPKQQSNGVGKPFSDQQLEDTISGKLVIYLAGYMTYYDGVSVDNFGKPKRRITWFCQRLIESLPTQRAVLSPDIQPNILLFGCPTWNCSDDACGTTT